MTRERCEEVLLPIVEDWRLLYSDPIDYEYVEIKFWSCHTVEEPKQRDGNSFEALIAAAWCYLFDGIYHPFVQLEQMCRSLISRSTIVRFFGGGCVLLYLD